MKKIQKTLQSMRQPSRQEADYSQQVTSQSASNQSNRNGSQEMKNVAWKSVRIISFIKPFIRLVNYDIMLFVNLRAFESDKNAIRMFGILHHHEQNQQAGHRLAVAWRQVRDPPRRHTLLVDQAVILLVERRPEIQRKNPEAKCASKEASKATRGNSIRSDTIRNLWSLWSAILCRETQVYPGTPSLGSKNRRNY